MTTNSLIYPHFKACDLLLAAGQLPALHCTHSVQHRENITENSRLCSSSVHYSWPLENFSYDVLLTSFYFPGKVEKFGVRTRFYAEVSIVLTPPAWAWFFLSKFHPFITQVQVASAFFSPSHVARSTVNSSDMRYISGKYRIGVKNIKDIHRIKQRIFWTSSINHV